HPRLGGRLTSPCRDCRPLDKVRSQLLGERNGLMSTRPVICFRKSLGPPRPPVANNLELRTFSPGDERYWLRLHHRCFVAGWAPAWDELDFAREFRARSWWADNR